MTSLYGAHLDLITYSNQGLSNTEKNDVVFYSLNTSQKILIGTSNNHPKLTITSNNIGISNINPVVSLDIYSTDAIKIPVGSTIQRPISTNVGIMRYNTTVNKYECTSNNNWNNIVLLNSNNYLGIENNNPQYPLDILGTMYISSNLYLTSNTVGINNSNPKYTLDFIGNINISSNLYVSNSNTKSGIANSNPKYTLDITGSVNISSNLYISNSTSKSGIGNSNPKYTLDITGSVNVSSNLYILNDIVIGNPSYKKIVDNSSNNLTITPFGYVPVINNISPFASVNESILLNNVSYSNTYIKIDNSQFTLNWSSTGMTIESWVYFNNTYGTVSAIPCFVGNMNTDSVNNMWSFGPVSTGKLCFYYYNGTLTYINGNTVMNLNQWNHIAMTYDTSDSKIRLWLNGILDNTATTYSGTLQVANSYLTIGRYNTNTGVNLYFTDLRLTKGALYNTTFTPSNIPLSTTSNTILLLQTSINSQYSMEIEGSLNTKTIYNLTASNIEDYEFPPGPMTGNYTTFSDGLYISSGSSAYSTTWAYYDAFTKNYGNASYFWHSLNNIYNGTGGLYNTTTYSTYSDDKTTPYYGEYIQLLMPNPIILTKYKIYNRGGWSTYTPTIFKLVGSSNNGTTWQTIDDQTNIYIRKDKFDVINFGNNKEDNCITFNVQNNTKAYNFYRLAINKTGGATFASIGELIFYGKKLANPTIGTSNLNVLCTNDKNVGIGTVYPKGRLHIYNENAIEDTLRLTNGTRYNEFHKSQIKFGYAGTTQYAHFIGTRHTTPTATYNCIDFYCHNGNNLGSNTILNGSTLVMTLEGTGNVGIGITNPGAQLDLSTANARKLTGTLWTISSDKRLKSNIIVANYDKCYEVLSNLDLKYYKWREDIPEINKITNKHQLGWLADDVELFYPKSILINKNCYNLSNLKSLNLDQIYANMYGTIKKIIKKNDKLKEVNNDIRYRINKIKTYKFD
jgi:hypothetical protein